MESRKLPPCSTEAMVGRPKDRQRELRPDNQKWITNYFLFLYSFRSVFILYTFVFTQCSPKLFVCVLVIERSAKPFSYFWLETGSYELIFVCLRVSKQNYIEIRWPQDKNKFSSGIKFALFSKVRKYEIKYRTKICDFTVENLSNPWLSSTVCWVNILLYKPSLCVPP